MYGQAARNAQQAYAAGMRGANLTNAPGLGGLGFETGRRVDAKLADEMLIRRTGNICIEAGAAGFKVVDHGRQFEFVRDNKSITGRPHRDRRQALINAAEVLAKNWLGI